MALNPGLALKASTEAYGHHNTLVPFTFKSNAMLPTDVTIETMVRLLASSSRTTSPSRRTEYG